MGEAIGQTLPVAVGVALSPVPIIAVVLMLTTARARTNGPAFTIGWLLGLGVIGTIVLLVAGPAEAGGGEAPATWVSWVKGALGILLLVLAVRSFRGRPRAGDPVEMPAWMDAIDRFTALKAAGTGAVLSGANPKNALLAVGAATTIAATGVSGGAQAVAYGIFALVGTVGVGVPVVLYVVLGTRSAAILTELKDWMSRHNAAIMSVLCLIIGVKLIGEAIGALA